MDQVSDSQDTEWSVRALRAEARLEEVLEERARLWSQLTSIAPGYLRYQARTSRTIPLAILRPASDASGAEEQTVG